MSRDSVMAWERLLEEISTQNRPPKKFNKIIVKIIIKYLLILEEEKKITTFLFVF